MRILHTADWHLGHTLREHPRHAEHEVFLAWLVGVCAERAVDVLLIAGDVFDTANPAPAALRLWFDFLGRLKRECPRIQVVVIAGNHDSAARLAAPAELLRGFDIHVVDAVRQQRGVVQVDDLLVPLRDAAGREVALCAAIPFLRLGDVVNLAPPVAAATDRSDVDLGSVLIPRPGDPLVAGEGDGGGRAVIDGMRALHQAVFARARERLLPGQALVAMAHGYLVGGALSELSERKVLGGNQHALPADLFPVECAYVALGHLHFPQEVQGRAAMRYSGSPLPLSMPEAWYHHRVVFADFVDGRLDKTWVLNTPRPCELMRLPPRGELDPAQALAAIEALPPRGAATDDTLLPFVEVAVRLASPMPGLVERLAARLQDKAVRLVRIEVSGTGSGTGGPGAATGGEPTQLSRLSPEDVFVRRYARDHAGEVPPALLAAFRELVEQVEHDGVA